MRVDEKSFIGRKLVRVRYYQNSVSDTAWLIRPNLERAELACELTIGDRSIVATWRLHGGGLDVRDSVAGLGLEAARIVDVSTASASWRQCAQERLAEVSLVSSAPIGGGRSAIDVLLLGFTSVAVAIAAVQYLDDLGRFVGDADELSIGFGPSTGAALMTLGLRSPKG